MEIKFDGVCFSQYPSGRYKKEGPATAQHLREDTIIPNLLLGHDLEIVMDGAAGFGASFLEECFGGLMRSKRITPFHVMQHMKIVTADASLKKECVKYMNEQYARL